MDNQIKTLPVIALRGMTVLPGMLIHFDISREKSIRAVEAGEKPTPEMLDFPGVADGVRGMKIVEAVVRSAKAGGRWTRV